jgi:hypothetical protein
MIANAMTAGMALTPTSSPVHGIVVDARGLVDPGGAANCFTNPFAPLFYDPVHNPTPASLAVTLLLGPITFRTTATWELARRSFVVGNAVTTIQAATTGFANTFPALVQFDDLLDINNGSNPNNGPLFGTGLQDLVVDCNSSSLATIGIRNQTSQEQTALDRVKITGCVDTGLEVTVVSAQNSGPYRDLLIIPSSSASTAYTTCARLGVSMAFSMAGTRTYPTHCGDDNPADTKDCALFGWRGIKGMTCDASNTSVQIRYGIDMSGQGGRLSNVYIKGAKTGVLLGANPNFNSNGAVLEGIQGCASVECGTNVLGTLVTLGPSSPANFDVWMSGLQLEGATTSGALTVNDKIKNSVCYSDRNVSLYVAGTGTQVPKTTAVSSATCPTGGL